MSEKPILEECIKDAVDEGDVSELIEMHRAGELSDSRIPADISGVVEGLLPMAVKNAVQKGILTEAIAVIGAEGIPEAVQMKAIDAIAKNKVGAWVGGLIGNREIPEAVQMKIIDVLAEGGWASEILDIVGAGNTSDDVIDRARFALAKAIIVAGEHQVKDLTTEEKIEALGILSRMVESRNPLQKDGVSSKGTVKKPASAAKDAKATKLTNKS